MATYTSLPEDETPIIGTDQDDSYIFSAGWGDRSISDTAGQESLFFTDASGIEDFAFARASNGDLVITIGSDSVTISTGSYGHGRYSLFYGDADDAEFLGVLYVATTRGEEITVDSNEDVLMFGAEGNDKLHGGDYDDVIYGMAGKDRLYGGEYDDTLYGGDGKDKLYGGEDEDTLHGGEGNDKLYGDEGEDTLHGGEGNDKLEGGEDDDTLHGGEGNDKLEGGEDDDRLYGGDGKDKLYGDEGEDTLHGGDGKDKLYGGDDDDRLDGGVGNDRLVGGDGNDTYIFRVGDNGVGNDERDLIDDDGGTVVFEQGASGVDYAGATYTWSNTYDGGEARTLTIEKDGNRLNVIEFANGISGYTFATRIGTRDTTLDSSTFVTAGVVAPVEPTTPDPTTPDPDPTTPDPDPTTPDPDPTTPDPDPTTPDFITPALASYDPTAVLGSEANPFLATITRDIFTGSRGADWISYQNATEDSGAVDRGVQVYLYSNRHTKYGYAAGDTLTGINNLIGSDFNDRLFGNSSDNRVYGGEGNDYLDGREGDDFLVGGVGDDSLYGYHGNDTVDGGEGDDTIYGGSGNDYLYGRVGADTLHGESGNDTIDGGEGDDIIYSGTGDDTIDGGDGIDTIYGGSGNDYIYGRGGDDYLYGDTGNDTIDGGVGVDTLDYYYSTARVIVDLATNSVSGGHAEGDTISNIENITGTRHHDILTGDSQDNVINGGSGGNDILDGGAGNDRLEGGSGNDILDGGAGNDRLEGGIGSDTYIFRANDNGAGSGERDIIDDASGKIVFEQGQSNADYREASYTWSRNDEGILSLTVENDGNRLNVIEFANMDGSYDFVTRINETETTIIPDYEILGTITNPFEGSRLADTFRGSGGVDWVSYQGATGSVTSYLDGRTGSQNYANGDRLYGINNLMGSAHGDNLHGNAIDNRLYGFGGNDEIYGGAGNDHLFGGGGDDQYIFSLRTTDITSNTASITDNQGNNEIRFNSSSLVYSDGSFTFVKSDDGNDLTISTVVTDDSGVEHNQQVTINDYYNLPQDTGFSIYYNTEEGSDDYIQFTSADIPA